MGEYNCERGIESNGTFRVETPHATEGVGDAHGLLGERKGLWESLYFRLACVQWMVYFISMLTTPHD